VTLTGTFTNCNNLVLVNGQAEQYATFVSGTSVTSFLLTSRAAGIYKVSVVDAQGQVSASQNFTVT
jgi:hypothetical protein